MHPEHFIAMSRQEFDTTVARYRERRKRSFRSDNLAYARKMAFDEGPVPKTLFDRVAWDFGIEVWSPDGPWTEIWAQIVNGDRDVRYLDSGPDGGPGGMMIYGLNAGARRYS